MYLALLAANKHQPLHPKTIKWNIDTHHQFLGSACIFFGGSTKPQSLTDLAPKNVDPPKRKSKLPAIMFLFFPGTALDFVNIDRIFSENSL